MPDAPLCAALLEKMNEQIERTVYLVGLIPDSRWDWQPSPDAWTTTELVGHLLDCISGFCAVLAAAEPSRLAHFARLRETPPSIESYRLHIEEGFAFLADADLARRVPTVFVAKGEPVLMLFLGNLEHLINHKHQLFVYLKQMGVPVGTPDLYRFRS
jgi:uncharacterized damage-inducible protein DinB